MAGGVFAGLGEVTLSWKLLVAVDVPSLTVTVILAFPFCPAAGVMVTVRLAPEPPKTRFACGIREGFPDDPETVRLEAAVSRSPIVNGMPEIAVS